MKDRIHPGPPSSQATLHKPHSPAFPAERIATYQSHPENSKPESSRSKKQKLSSLDVEAVSPSRLSLPSVVIAGGRKRNSSSCSTSQVDYMVGTSTSVTERVADTDEERPLKRYKRSLSTPPAPRPSQLSGRLPQSRRRTQSRAGSPVSDMEHVLPSRRSARLARKINPLINSRSSDIYTYLAGPDGARSLLSEPPADSVILSTPNVTVSSQSDKKPRGRRRKTVDLTDENTKKDLMEEWARMRQSQGTLPLSGTDENACFGQLLQLYDTRKGDESVSRMRFRAATITRSSSPDIEFMPERSQTTIVGTPQSQETALGDSLWGSSSTPMDFENALLAAMDVSGKTLDTGLALSPDGGVEQLIVPSVDMEAQSSILDPHMDEDAPSDELANVSESIRRTDLLKCSGSLPPTSSASLSRQGSAQVKYTKPKRVPVNEEVEAVDVNNSSRESPSAISHVRSFDGSMCFDSHEEFYMLDIPEVLTLPWVPVASQLYVPPGLGKLIFGMREQLKVEARARRRAEELYQAELNRRIAAEKITEGLRTELGKRQTELDMARRASG